MADYSFPWQAWLQAQQARAQNRMAGPELIGQSLQSLGQIGGDAYKALQQKKLQQQQLQTQQNAMQQLSSQYPQLATMLNVVPPEQRGAVVSAFVKEQQAPKKPMVSVLVDPSKPEGAKMSIVADDYVPKEKGQKVVQMPADVAIARETTQSMGGERGGFFKSKTGQILLSDLPSNMSSTSVPGAAAQVKLSARQGRALIANPGAWQKLGLSGADVARTIMRNAPTEDMIKAADFSNTLTMKWDKIKSQLSADPNQMDTPKMRKAVYDTLGEMSESVTPIINNQLKTMEDIYDVPKNWNDIKNRELYRNVEDVPFQEGTFMTPTTQNDGWTPLPGGGSFKVK